LSIRIPSRNVGRQPFAPRLTLPRARGGHSRGSHEGGQSPARVDPTGARALVRTGEVLLEPLRSGPRAPTARSQIVEPAARAVSTSLVFRAVPWWHPKLDGHLKAGLESRRSKLTRRSEPLSLRRHGQHLERHEEAASHCPRAVRLDAAPHLRRRTGARRETAATAQGVRSRWYSGFIVSQPISP